MTDDLVRLTTVPTEGEAEMICSLLRVNGIECGERILDAGAGALGQSGSGGWREVLVHQADLATAQELIAPQPE